MAVDTEQPHLAQERGHDNSGFWKLLLGCIGVVYGDIGTSPLYALREAVVHAAADGLEDAEVIGVVSLLFWALTLVVTVKYICLILQADNNGEGGTLSLLALVQRIMGRKMFLALIGVVGASLFYGDAVITPAISVLSAIEGLKLVTPGLDRWILPITTVILVLLFAVQNRGTGRIAALFGPITLVWFIAIGLLGLLHIGDRPDILHALNPLRAFFFLLSHGFLALIILGSVFLAITGAEALYADMGHFGRKPIRVAWIVLVFPALALNYLGQGALIMADNSALENPFYLMAPDWARLPLVILAAMATVIASQAVITGAFSLTQQAIQLGLLPRLEIQHTSEEQFGQIYIPKVNLFLFIGVMVLVWTFQTSGKLASAYGIAVTGNMIVTSILAFMFFWKFWKWSPIVSALVVTPFLVLESVFLGSNMLKVLDGGYAPLGLATVLTIVMWTWMRGTRIVYAKARRESIALTDLTHMLQRSQPMRARGTAVFLTSDTQMAPSALMHNLKHNGVLHERNIIMTIVVENTPRVALEDRVRIEPISDLFTRVFLTFGYMEEPNVPKALSLAKKKGLKFEIMSTSFFLSRRVFRATANVGMPQWQDRLYISMAISAADTSNYYCLPTNRVVEMGQQFTI
ncbi:putative potassium transport system protein kup 2 [Aureimonas endophytica]|uniref:Probable potassium transport system protein Kup n=1 Tax=Aureimonas endophytica TaxID=2027858 RepID=A0A916ZFN4_9HYPH|nr:potassium transporter Kup [Aureimonas endophytica]GGD92626.1 putative potassium transport system protein kup 2 [Aureimonas endophytica]